ncbi:MAG: pknB 3 [Marmoricola sp.]|nr:pknB 3 [Marmoricola sp.]
MTNPVSEVVPDRYVVSSLAGSGGMADVYRCTDRVLGREVAVKVLRSTTTGYAERERFAAEARTLASLNHPGLVTILDAGVRDEHPYLVMELLDGPTLSRRLRDAGPLGSAEIAAIGSQLAAALAYAHDRGIVHRDVKPGNILLCPDGRAVLTDFGIARLLTDTSEHTRTGDVIGSPAYLSPEQVNGTPPTTAVDVYSLGLVLLEAATGARAYPGPPIEAAIARLSASPAIPLSLDPALRRLVVAMTALEPADRPTAHEVAATLQDTSTVSTPADLAVPLDATQAIELPAALTAETSLLAETTSHRAPARRRTAVLAGLAAAALVGVALMAMALPGAGSPSRAAAVSGPSSTPTTQAATKKTTGAKTQTTAKAVVAKAPARHTVHAPSHPVKHRPPGHAKHKKPHGHGHGHND